MPHIQWHCSWRGDDCLIRSEILWSLNQSGHQQLPTPPAIWREATTVTRTGKLQYNVIFIVLWLIYTWTYREGSACPELNNQTSTQPTHQPLCKFTIYCRVYRSLLLLAGQYFTAEAICIINREDWTLFPTQWTFSNVNTAVLMLLNLLNSHCDNCMIVHIKIIKRLPRNFN